MTGLFDTGQSAILSHDGVYRFRLGRKVADTGRVALFIGVNPSTADADTDDATIRKIRGFSQRNNIARFMVGNKFAFRATDVRVLRSAVDPVGPYNDGYLETMMREADVVIAAWGPLAKLPQNLRGRWKRILAIAEFADKPLHCFGTAQDGQPRHPLMLAYETHLIPWNPLK